jgi:hypothetical protein
MSFHQNHLEIMGENTTFAITAEAVSILPAIRLQMSRYAILFVIIFGNIGSLFSIAVYRRPKFSTSSCTSYLIAVSINTFLFVNFALLTRLMEVGFKSMNFTSKSLAFCRIRSLLYHAITTYHMFSLVMASFDRFLVTRLIFYRKKTSNIICFLLAVLCLLAYAHVLKYFTIDSRLKSCCACFSTFYKTFFVWLYMSVYCLLPVTLMAIFGILTVRKIHQMRIVLPQRASAIRHREHHLIRIVLATVVLTLVLTLPFGVKNLYFVFGPPIGPDNTFSAELQKLLEEISRVLLYVNHIMSFYINLVASKSFRQEFIDVVKSWKKKFRKLPMIR